VLRRFNDRHVLGAIIASVMLPPRRLRPYIFVLAVICTVPSLSAVIVETREYHGKQVQCMHGGNWLNPVQLCGTQFYERVFTGTVDSVVETSDTDKRLVLVPHEVFLGSPVSKVTAAVNQACLPPNEPEIQPGDMWLFYLRSSGYSPNDTIARELTVPFDSPSKPLSEAADDIAMLRHLKLLTDSGILAGNVRRTGETYDRWSPAPVANREIVAKNSLSGVEYRTVTNRHGHFEFDLPEGQYDVTANVEPGLREVKNHFQRGSPHVWKRGCVDVGLIFEPIPSSKAP
jgi:hypothetical protein